MSAENKQSSVFTMYRGRLTKVGVLVFFSLLMMIIYVSFFQHPPPDQLLENNRRTHLSSGHLDFGASLFGNSDDNGDENDGSNRDDKEDENNDDLDEDDDNDDALDNDDSDEDDDDDDNNDDDIDKDDGDDNGGSELEESASDNDEEDKEKSGGKDDSSDDNSNNKKELDHKVQSSPSGSESDKSDKEKAQDDILSHQKRELANSEEIENADYWVKFLKQQNLVPIGAVYNKCDGHRVQLGTVVLMEDKENGGIKARTYVNITLDHPVDGGQFNIDSRYNGRGLYDNYWELCEIEDDLPEEEKTFVCPLKAGKYTRVKDKPIPGFLPKGRFQSKIWATDQDGKMIGCGYSDFTI